MKPVTDITEKSTPTTLKVAGKGLKVERAFLHQAVSWSGVINSEKTLDGLPTVHGGNRIKGLESMTLHPEGLVIDVRIDGEVRTAVVPGANVALALLEKGQKL